MSEYIEAEDLQTGERVRVPREPWPHRLIGHESLSHDASCKPWDGCTCTPTINPSHYYLVDDALADHLNADHGSTGAFAGHLEKREGEVTLMLGQSFVVPPGEQSLLAALGHPGTIEDFWEAFEQVERLLSQRFKAWGPPRHAASFAPGSFDVTGFEEK